LRRPADRASRKDGIPAPRVLLVDDDEDYTLFVKRLLGRMGYSAPLDIVHDEKAAVKALNEREYDVVVSDYELRPGNGLRVLEHVKRLSPKARRILLTSAPEEAQKHLCQEQGLTHSVWDKRWELGTIRERLTTLLEPAT
jgi:CheY-like chemotaxis protein